MRLRKEVGRCAQKLQHRVDEHDACHARHGSAYERHRHRGVDRLREPPVVVAAKVLTADDRAARADPQRKAHNQLVERAARGDAAHRERAGVASDHVGVDERVGLLEERLHKDGQAEQHELLPDASLCYIECAV